MRQYAPAIFVGHTTYVQALAFLPGERLVSGSGRFALKVWDAPKRTLIAEFGGDREEGVTCLAVEPAGKWFAAVGTQSIVIYDATTYRPLRTLTGELWAAVSPNGRWLATGLDAKVQVFDTATWKLAATLTDHHSLTLGGCFSPDGERLATCSTDRTVRLWDADTWKPIGEPWRRPLPVSQVIYTSDGLRLVEAMAKAVNIVDPVSGKILKTLDQTFRSRVFLAASPAPRLFAADCDNAEVKIFDAHSGREVRSLRGHTFGVTALAFGRDGRRLASVGADLVLRLWDLRPTEETKELTRVDRWAGKVVAAPDGKRLALCRANVAGEPEGIRVVDTATGATVRLLPGFGAAAFCDDGRRLVACRQDGGVSLWSVETGRELKSWKLEEDKARDLTLSPDERLLAVGTSMGRVYLFDFETGAQVGAASTNWSRASGLIFIPGETRLVIAASHGYRVWDYQAQRLDVDLEGAPRIHAIALSPDGRQVATAEPDRVVRLRDVSTGKVARALASSPVQIGSLAFHPDGDRLAAHCHDGQVRIWDVESGHEVAALVAAPPSAHFIGDVLWSRDGARLYSSDAYLKCWYAPPP
jgi:WD40 repeat protein